MRIKKIRTQTRRDFEAIYECEHCRYTEIKYGYDDANFHANVVPEMVCGKCNQKANKAMYRPLTTKYPEGFQI